MASVRVCPNYLPWCPEGFWMDEWKIRELDTMIKAIDKDFDFVGLYSGRGTVRIGKSVNAMQDGLYITLKVREKFKVDIPFNEIDNFAFKGDELIEKAKKLPPYSVIIYDEAGSDLVGRKFMQATTQALLDFFRECGQLNLFFLCVLPDYFELPRAMAINRSTYLVDVDFKEAFQRGKFRFYGPRAKKMLYLMGKKWLDYDAFKPDFHGSFPDVYTIDEQAYRNRKFEALTGRKKDDEDKIQNRQTRTQLRLSGHRLKLIILLKEKGMTQEEISKQLEITPAEVSKIVNGVNSYG